MNTTLESPTRSTADNTSTAIHTVTPYLVCAGAADAIAFYTKAFGAVEEVRINGKNGHIMHARVRIGDACIMVMEEEPEWGALGPKAMKGSPVSLHLYVPDADATMARAVEAGATVVMPMEDMFWGDRYGMVEDPFGHRWSLGTHQRDMSAEEMQKAAQAACMGG